MDQSTRKGSQGRSQLAMIQLMPLQNVRVRKSDVEALLNEFSNKLNSTSVVVMLPHPDVNGYTFHMDVYVNGRFTEKRKSMQVLKTCAYKVVR